MVCIHKILDNLFDNFVVKYGGFKDEKLLELRNTSHEKGVEHMVNQTMLNIGMHHLKKRKIILSVVYHQIINHCSIILMVIQLFMARAD